MRTVFEVFDFGPGVETVWNQGPGGEQVRLVHESGFGATPVQFASGPGFGAIGVHIIDGGLPRSEMMQAQQPAVDPPNPDLLSPTEHALLGRISQLWEQQQNGDQRPEVFWAIVDAAIDGLAHSWADARWAENFMFMGSNAALWLHRNGTAGSGERLQSMANEVERYGWQSGGPSGLFEPHEAADLFYNLRATVNPPEAESKSTRRWFKR